MYVILMFGLAFLASNSVYCGVHNLLISKDPSNVAYCFGLATYLVFLTMFMGMMHVIKEIKEKQ